MAGSLGGHGAIVQVTIAPSKIALANSVGG